MTRKVIVLFLFLVSLIAVNGQATAYRGGNYTGVLGVFSNPANIASNPRKWDVNVLSISGVVANDGAEADLFKVNDLEDQLFESDKTTLSGIINLDIVGASFFFRLNPKHSIAFTSRARVFGNIGTLDMNFADEIDGGTHKLNSLPYRLSVGSQQVTLNAWNEIGFSWGGLIFEEKKHSLKVGATVKLLRGIGNSFVNMQDLKGAINADDRFNPYLTDASGSLHIVNSGLDMFRNDLIVSDFLKSNGNGIGFDLGVVYEYKDKTDSISWCENCYNKGYKFKVRVSLLDVGSIKYETVANNAFNYALNIPNGGKFYLNGLDGSVEEVRKFLEKSPYAKKGEVEAVYKPSLPTTLNLMADYYWGRHFFTELSARFSLVDTDKPENAYLYNSVTLTPRFEGKYFGLYLPLNYNDISAFNAGVTLRMGPLMIGSGSVLSSLLTESHQADIFVGLRFGL